MSSRFKRASKYDMNWMISNEMGPNAIWLMEFLTESIEFKSGMRVLDLGCGKAMSSIFLAKEFNVQVWATDLWISPSENYKNVLEQKMSELVFPIRAEAHSLPFAENFFDIILSADAYHYFGTDEMYLPYILKFLKTSGIIGVVSPGLQNEIDIAIPERLKDYWEPEFCSFHSAEWWKRHWEKTGLVEIITADTLPDGWKVWYEWEKLLSDTRGISESRGSDLELLIADNGQNLCFPRIIVRKK